VKSALNTTRILWSLAILEKLRIEDHFQYCREIVHIIRQNSQLDRYKTAHFSSRHTAFMIQQILNEFEICLNGRGDKSTADYKTEIRNLRHYLSQYTTLRKGVNSTEKSSRASIDGSGLEFTAAAVGYSSNTHLEASALLNELCVAHVNEHLLQDGILVDVFVPSSRCRGVVIEFDGPSHFDSFLRVSRL
jgi:hypothetical protein